MIAVVIMDSWQIISGFVRVFACRVVHDRKVVLNSSTANLLDFQHIKIYRIILSSRIYICMTVSYCIAS